MDLRNLLKRARDTKQKENCHDLVLEESGSEGERERWGELEEREREELNRKKKRMLKEKEDVHILLSVPTHLRCCTFPLLTIFHLILLALTVS